MTCAIIKRSQRPPLCVTRCRRACFLVKIWEPVPALRVAYRTLIFLFYQGVGEPCDPYLSYLYNVADPTQYTFCPVTTVRPVKGRSPARDDGSNMFQLVLVAKHKLDSPS